tara:strand:- start:55470 stop:56684 length:1215 start_codon:yes stop_codon:yes gene_type:complete
MTISLKKIGPGLLFAGAAIGVSHLVQSTKAGAEFGFGLIWALLLVNVIKYPFFKYGPLYTVATGESLLEGYKKLGKGLLLAYLVITFASMFTIQTAVTTVTASIASTLFQIDWPTKYWSLIILILCFGLLVKGKYVFLDKLMKIIVILLTITTIVAVILAINHNKEPLNLAQHLPSNSIEIAFLIAFMGWMPAPLDVSVWHSLWAVEKKKLQPETSKKISMLDFNIGYLTTVLIGMCFLALGALIMFKSNESFSDSGSTFATQLINMYTKSLGNWAYWLIGIAALTTMLSTTFTTLDASPRSMSKALQLFGNKSKFNSYIFWLLILTVGSIIILFGFVSQMGILIKISTILSFLTAPFYAIINYKLIISKHTPKAFQPSTLMKLYSTLSILLLIGFSIWFLSTF